MKVFRDFLDLLFEHLGMHHNCLLYFYMHMEDLFPDIDLDN